MWQVMIKVRIPGNIWYEGWTYEWRPAQTGDGTTYKFINESNAKNFIMSYYGQAYFNDSARIEKVSE